MNAPFLSMIRPLRHAEYLRDMVRTRNARKGLPIVNDDERPFKREDCAKIPRPCPFVGCRHHLYLTVNETTGAIHFPFGDGDPLLLTHSCSLDVAEMGFHNQDEVAALTNSTQENVSQAEKSAKRRLLIAIDNDEE